MYWIPAILVLPYFFILLWIWRNLLKINQFDHKPERSVFVSVIIPCKNEEHHLLSLLGDIARQDYSPDSFEVIVVDDNSSDGTYDVAVSFNGIRNLSIIRNSGAGKKEAIRTGVNASSGPLIITTDADCRMKEKWMVTIAAFYHERNPDMLVCPVQLENRSGFFGRFQELEFLSLQGVTAGCIISKNATMGNGANLAFTKEIYSKHVNYLHNEIASGDDIFFLHSLKNEPLAKIMWLESNEVMVTASSSPTLKRFFYQRKRWISKGRAYNDMFTILLAIVTFVTNFLIIFLLTASLFNSMFVKVLITGFLLKAIPDFLILINTTKRYRREGLMKWFLPSEILYPVYVISVALFSLFNYADEPVNYPSRKGI